MYIAKTHFHLCIVSTTSAPCKNNADRSIVGDLTYPACSRDTLPVVGISVLLIVRDARNRDGVHGLPVILLLFEVYRFDLILRVVGQRGRQHLHIRLAHMENVRSLKAFLNISLQGGYQHRRKNRENGKNNDQLHEGEAPFVILQFVFHSFLLSIKQSPGLWVKARPPSDS